jgi:hypothetical protein
LHFFKQNVHKSNQGAFSMVAPTLVAAASHEARKAALLAGLQDVRAYKNLGPDPGIVMVSQDSLAFPKIHLFSLYQPPGNQEGI